MTAPPIKTLPSKAYCGFSPRRVAATVESRPFWLTGRFSPVDEQKAPRAVGVLRLPLFKTALAEQRRLLIPRDSRDRYRHAPHVCRSVHLPRRAHFGKERTRNAEKGQKFVVPIERVDVEEHGAGGVGAVGDVRLSARQFPYQPGIHRPEQQLSPLRALPRPFHVVENPFDLARGKIGVGDQARLLPDHFRMPLPLQRFDDGRRPTALPDDRVTDGFARLPIP